MRLLHHFIKRLQRATLRHRCAVCDRELKTEIARMNEQLRRIDTAICQLPSEFGNESSSD